MNHRAMLAISAFALAAPCAPGAQAQSYSTSGPGWTSSYGFPTANDRAARNQSIDLIGRAEAGAYENGTAIGGGATGTGGSYVVGAINNSTNTVNITGDGNTVTIGNSATSTGCQDGRITISTGSDGSIDITGRANGAAAQC